MVYLHISVPLGTVCLLIMALVMVLLLKVAKKNSGEVPELYRLLTLSSVTVFNVCHLITGIKNKNLWEPCLHKDLILNTFS